MGYLTKKDNYYICSNCRMRQQELLPYCWFCDTLFTNISNILIREWDEDNYNQLIIKGDFNEQNKNKLDG